MVFAFGALTPFYGIAVIVCISASVQMGWLDAKLYITLVTNKQTVRYGAMR